MVNLSASNAHMAPKTHPLDDLLQQGILKGHGLGPSPVVSVVRATGG
jgi:hypothetical protein